MAGPIIETRGLTRRFGRQLAVDHLDWTVSGPGIVGLLGPNGAGKTTTMRLLTGFLPMTAGTAVVAGHDVFDAPLEVKARVGYLPEAPPIYPELTVGEYLRFVAELRGVPRSGRLRRIGAVMGQVGLTRYERRLTGALSRGYRQRLGLAQALVHDPPLLILDEPTTGLDPVQLVGIRALIMELAKERTVVLSTHVLSEVERLCSRVVVLDRGRIVGDGTVEELAASVGAGPWLELEVVGAPDDISAQLASLDAVTGVRALGGSRYRVEGEAGPEVGALLADRGWGLSALSRHSASLDEAFLALTGGDA